MQRCQAGCGAAAHEGAEGVQSAESMSKPQADKDASDDRLAAMMAEIKEFKQEAADAEAKSRADRKVSNIKADLSLPHDLAPSLPSLGCSDVTGCHKSTQLCTDVVFVQN